MINSRQKGKRGELEACRWLRSLGYAAERGVQYCGRAGAADIVVAELPHVHFEVKYGVTGLDLETELLTAAINQARADRQLPSIWPVVLWKPLRKPWRLTTLLSFQGSLVWGTVTGANASRVLSSLRHHPMDGCE